MRYAASNRNRQNRTRGVYKMIKSKQNTQTQRSLKTILLKLFRHGFPYLFISTAIQFAISRELSVTVIIAGRLYFFH